MARLTATQCGLCSPPPLAVHDEARDQRKLTEEYRGDDEHHRPVLPPDVPDAAEPERMVCGHGSG
jgi:hypothetical protein